MAKHQSNGSKVLDGELRWYWCDRDGDLGRHSVSLEPSIRGDRDPGPSDAQMAAAAQARRVEAALHTLSIRDQRALRVAHTPLLPGLRAALADLGDLAGVVVDTVAPGTLAAALRDAHQRGRAAHVAREAARALLTRWQADAAVRVGQAVAAYRAERRGLALAERRAERAREQSRSRERAVRAMERSVRVQERAVRLLGRVA